MSLQVAVAMLGTEPIGAQISEGHRAALAAGDGGGLAAGREDLARAEVKAARERCQAVGGAGVGLVSRGLALRHDARRTRLTTVPVAVY